MITPTANPDGLLFGPTASGKNYLSTYEHRGRNVRKSQWAADVIPPEEYEIFEHADVNDHADSDGHYWGVRNPCGAVLGSRGERLAKFPHNGTETAPWHGYPVSPASGRSSEIPPDGLIEALVEAGSLSRTFGRKIQRRRS